MNIEDSQYFGRMNDPDGSAYVKGICGDTMEFYLIFKGDVVQSVKYFTDGCEHTRSCADTAAKLVEGKEISEALALSPAMIKNELPDLPSGHLHCTILTTITFLKALAEFIYKRENS